MSSTCPCLIRSCWLTLLNLLSERPSRFQSGIPAILESMPSYDTSSISSAHPAQARMGHPGFIASNVPSFSPVGVSYSG